MPALPIFYSTRDGHSRRIAERIASRLTAAGVDAQAVNVAPCPPLPEAVRELPIFVLIAAVRYGRHLKDADLLLRRYVRIRSAPPLALASVNLTARKPDKRTALSSPYLRKWIKRHKLSPVLATAFAGRLDYPSYKWWEREAIRLIMTLTGGETDPLARIEYTSWQAVDEFADRLKEQLTGGRSAACAGRDCGHQG